MFRDKISICAIEFRMKWIKYQLEGKKRKNKKKYNFAMNTFWLFARSSVCFSRVHTKGKEKDSTDTRHWVIECTKGLHITQAQFNDNLLNWIYCQLFTF